MGRILFYILCFLIFFAFTVNAATYDAYFSNAATGNATGTDTAVALSDCDGSNAANTCSTLAHAQAYIELAGSGDTVTLYFDQGDTWSENTDAVSTTVTHGLNIETDDPIVHIDAYGAGAKPIFDGTVSDFSTVPEHNDSTGPYRWNTFFTFLKNDCSVKNVKINGVYGYAIAVGNDTTATDGFMLESSDITNFGYSVIGVSINHGTQYSTVTKCLIHTGQQLVRYGKDGSGETPGLWWGGAIRFGPTPGADRNPIGNVFSYNVMYDIYGEGISGTGLTVEHNIIGSTNSVAIYVAPQDGDAVDSTVRYNLIMKSSGTHGNGDGIVVADENSGGVNTGATVEIYGNTVINRWIGVRFVEYHAQTSQSPWKEVRVYNNTVIDCSSRNFYIGPNHDMISVGGGYFYNNLSILYDRTGDLHTADEGNPADLSTYWTIGNNHFWDATEGDEGTVDVDWRTNYIVTDPKLEGEETSGINWDGLTAVTDVDWVNVIPESDGGGINNGGNISADHPTWQSTLLSTGTTFGAGDPAAIVAVLIDQDVVGDITGAGLPGFYIHSEYPSALQACGTDPQAVTFGVTSSANATCRFSVKGADTCATAIASLDEEFETTGATTTHNDTDETFACSATSTLVVKCQDDATSDVSNCVEITVEVAAAGGAPPQAAPGTIIGGGDLLIIGGGEVSIH